MPNHCSLKRRRLGVGLRRPAALIIERPQRVRTQAISLLYCGTRAIPRSQFEGVALQRQSKPIPARGDPDARYEASAWILVDLEAYERGGGRFRLEPDDDLDLALLQVRLEDLADARDRQRGGDPHALGNGRALRDVRGGEFEQLLLGDARPPVWAERRRPALRRRRRPGCRPPRPWRRPDGLQRSSIILGSMLWPPRMISSFFRPVSQK